MLQYEIDANITVSTIIDLYRKIVFSSLNLLENYPRKT